MILAHSIALNGPDIDKRRHQRVPVVVAGRYMLQDRNDYPCQTVNISPGGLALNGPVRGQLGERVIAYLDHLGRVEGQIARLTPTGFAMTISATVRKREKIAAQLTWLINRKALGLPEDRRHDRLVPKNPRVILTLHDNSEVTVRLLDVSLSGAAVATHLKPELGTQIYIGKIPARVVRFVEGGIALEFSRLLNEDNIDDQLAK
ncbi:MAG: PilZ domain-containing protein [Beijerinckiaceae bacterium]|nr:PilZ domain-containing protein [Beijerinckiaceae bacterium]